jgi:hypothetical protein
VADIPSPWIKLEKILEWRKFVLLNITVKRLAVPPPLSLSLSLSLYVCACEAVVSIFGSKSSCSDRFFMALLSLSGKML